MRSEKELISIIAKNLPRSKRQINNIFESDSEILQSKKGYMLFSVDDYSEEDHFRTHNPYKLGWNLTVATISDIFASGGVPAYFAHSMSVNQNWDKEYIEEFSRGIKDVLEKAEAFFIGGDFGFAENWHYTGIVLGKSYRQLTRYGAQPGDTIFMTGDAGCANLDAALQLFDSLNRETELKFELRNKEAKLITKYASSCIDSSDGLVNSLMTISEVNQTGFSLHNSNINPVSQMIAEKMEIPPLLLILGECGEYELVFTVKNENIPQLLKEATAQNLKFTSIGKITSQNQKTLKTAFQTLDLQKFNIKGRDFPIEADYISALTDYLIKHGTGNFKNSYATRFQN